jgi:hypothetical protein
MRAILLVVGMLVTSIASTQEPALGLWSYSTHVFCIEAARADAMIRWRSTAEALPFSISQAELLARGHVARRYPQLDEVDVESIQLHRVVNRPEYSDLWYYLVMFVPPPFYRRDFGDDAYFLAVLMMDGSVVEPLTGDRCR